MGRMLGRMLLVSFVMCLAACGSRLVLPTSTAFVVTISAPANTTLSPGQTAQFAASVSNTSNTSVIWEVNSVVGGNAQVGTITVTGLYTAPTSLPSTPGSTSATVTITAAAAANTSSVATQVVTLIAAPVVSVSPATANVFTSSTQQFTASVTQTSTASVIWQVNNIAGGNSTAGTITSTGLYTAPATRPNPASVTITAVSTADSSSTASSSVTILAAPVITLSTNTASVMATRTYQFTASLSDNSSVNWEVNGVSGGNSTLGTISVAGLYTAPTVIPSPATVTVTALSAEDPLVTESAQVTITPLLQVVVTPPSITLQPLQTQTFSAQSTISNDTIKWEVNNVIGGDSTNGTITQAGVYTAPDPVPAAGFVTVEAYSVLQPTIFGAALVTLGSTPPSVTVSPATANVAIANTENLSATVSPSTLSQAVTWQVNGINNGNSTVGTISSTGSSTATYTAPILIPSPATVTITAISSAQPTITGSAKTTVTLPGTISVAVTPNPVTRTLGQSQQFTATVTPNNNPNVNWSLSSTDLDCNTDCGGISSTGMYTAPTNIPNSLQSGHVNVIATSQADPSKSGSAQVTVTASPSITITPSSQTLAVTQSQMFSAQLAHVPSGTTVSWTLGCINADDGADDTCVESDPHDDGDDGPGSIAAPSGSSLSDSMTVTYTAPGAVFFSSFPQNVCPSADQVTFTYAYVPLTASMIVSGQTYSTFACIKVTP